MTPRCCRGLDVILAGHSVVGAGSPVAKQYLVMHIENPKGLVEKEKGAGLAWATDLLVPEFIENQIYSKVKEQLQQQFKEKGSAVSVDIVQSPPDGSKPRSDLFGGIVVGALLAALGFGATKLGHRRH